MNLIAVAMLATARVGGGPALPSEMSRFYAGAGLSELIFVGEEEYTPSLMLDTTLAYDFAAGSSVEMMLGYCRMADLHSSALHSVPVMLNLKLGKEWLYRARSGRTYMLLSGGGILHSYELSAHDEENKKQQYKYNSYDYSVAPGLAWCLGAGVEVYSYTNRKMFLSLDFLYMWHQAEGTHNMDGSKVSETLDLDALVLRAGLTYQF